MKNLTWVRGNTVLMAVTLKQKNTDGTETPIDISGYDSWAANVYRVTDFQKTVVDTQSGLDDEGRIILTLPSKLHNGNYSVEVLLSKEEANRRSYEIPVFKIVETNAESDITYDIVQAMISADIEMEFQLLPIAEILGKNAYEMWHELNPDKTMQDFIDDVLDLNGITEAAVAATQEAHEAAQQVGLVDIIGEDNYVYHWQNDGYVKTDIYVKGERGETGAQGERGEQGEQGAQGIKGDKGDKGERGEQGIQGAQGERGIQGEQGVQGIQGERGEKGDKGDKGDAGAKGDKGDVGTTPDVSATASVSDTTGTPTVVVTKGGTTVAPVLNFAFSGLKQDVSDKEDKVSIIGASGETLNAEIGKYYRFAQEVNTLAVTLPSPTDSTHLSNIIFYIPTGTTPAITFSSTNTILYQKDFSLEASKTYEINALWNGAAWVIAAVEIEIPTT